MVKIPTSWIGEIGMLNMQAGDDNKGLLEEIEHGCLGEAEPEEVKAMLEFAKDPKTVEALTELYNNWEDVVKPVVASWLCKKLTLIPEVEI